MRYFPFTTILYNALTTILLRAFTMKKQLVFITLAISGSFMLSACLPEETIPEPNTTWYVDADNDGFGDTNDAGTASTNKPTGYVGNNNDCNDNNSDINPNAVELLNTFDDNCNGVIDEGFSTYYKDADGDNYGNALLSHDGQPDNSYVLDNTDCNDNDAAIYPGAVEAFNLKDDDCDASIDEDFSFTTYNGSYSEGIDLASWTKYSHQIPPYDSLTPKQVFEFGVGTHTVSGSGKIFADNFNDNNYDYFLVRLPIELQITNVQFSVPSLPANISSLSPGLNEGIRFYPKNSSLIDVWVDDFTVESGKLTVNYTRPITMDNLYDSVTFSCCGGSGNSTPTGSTFSYSFAITVEQIAGTCTGDYDCDSIANFDDNCPFDANASQDDADFNGIGDSCEP